MEEMLKRLHSQWEFFCMQYTATSNIIYWKSSYSIEVLRARREHTNREYKLQFVSNAERVSLWGQKCNTFFGVFRAEVHQYYADEECAEVFFPRRNDDVLEGNLFLFRLSSRP